MSYIINLKNVSLFILFPICIFIFGCSTKPYVALQNTKYQGCINIFKDKTQNKLLQKMCLSMPFESAHFIEDDTLKIQAFSKKDKDDKMFYTYVFLSFKSFEDAFYLYEYGQEEGFDNGTLKKINMTEYFYCYYGTNNTSKQYIYLDSLDDKLLESLKKKRWGC
ncbi:hypothetical protein LS73_009215 [Helicobacter muridarum]|uniref:Uncharacterized protein n=1 Tax=Helicobacter muridarum TaxID=216 RepID=A0A099U0V1_9HELI|nr:hypothetical protein [Helicobacter muridarum]TLD98230.1 hypothetical protein LS73_009215 [Helicobacter muridarum]STQ85470.1 Uncharacterised protein [Helicobacter muridarum]